MHEVIIGERQKDGSIPVMIDSKQYYSMNAMMKELHTNQTAIYAFEKDGYSREEAISLAIDKAKRLEEERKNRREKRRAASKGKVRVREKEPEYQKIILHVVNPAPEIPDEDIWEEVSRGRTYAPEKDPKEPAWHKRLAGKRKKYATDCPFCPTCDHPLFKYEHSIGDFVWGFGGDHTYESCPGCGQKIRWEE